MKGAAVAVLPLLAFVAVGCGDDDVQNRIGIEGPAQIRIDLEQQNASGEFGTVVLFPLPNRRTRVAIELSGMPREGTQPAQIHEGTCDDLDPKAAYSLRPVREQSNGFGRSVTQIQAGLEELEAGSHAVNVQRSVQAPGRSVACADIPSP
jgi:hypothetical protein